MRRSLTLIVGALTLIIMSGCTKDVHDKCVETLSDKIHVGATQREAESALEACGCTHSFDAKTNTIQGTKPAQRRWFMQSDWNVLISLDQAKKVKSVVVKKIVTGP